MDGRLHLITRAMLVLIIVALVIVACFCAYAWVTPVPSGPL